MLFEFGCCYGGRPELSDYNAAREIGKLRRLERGSARRQGEGEHRDCGISSPGDIKDVLRACCDVMRLAAFEQRHPVLAERYEQAWALPLLAQAARCFQQPGIFTQRQY